MEPTRFDSLVRVVTTRSRREAILALLGGVLGLSGLYQADAGMMGMGMMGMMGMGKGKRKRCEPDPTPNAFGCLNVGQPCRGQDSACCSGRCQGRSPRRGECDRSRCVSHDESTCLPGQQAETCGGQTVTCTSTAGQPGFCNTTTGEAAYCLAAGGCFPCQRDAHCEGVCGPGAACIRCANCPVGTSCAGTGATSCTF